MFRRILLIGAVVLAAGSVALAPSAGAQEYGGCVATVSDTTPAPGQTVTVSGTGAVHSGSVFASVGGVQIGTGTSDADGNFSFSATIPATATGTVNLKVNCGSEVGVEVLSLTISGSGVLPATGSSSTLPMTTIAIGVLALGGVVLAAARYRAKATKTSL